MSLVQHIEQMAKAVQGLRTVVESLPLILKGIDPQQVFDHNNNSNTITTKGFLENQGSINNNKLETNYNNNNLTVTATTTTTPTKKRRGITDTSLQSSSSPSRSKSKNTNKSIKSELNEEEEDEDKEDTQSSSPKKKRKTKSSKETNTTTSNDDDKILLGFTPQPCKNIQDLYNDFFELDLQRTALVTHYSALKKVPQRRAYQRRQSIHRFVERFTSTGNFSVPEAVSILQRDMEERKLSPNEYCDCNKNNLIEKYGLAEKAT